MFVHVPSSSGSAGMPGMWSGVNGPIPNPGLGSGGGLGYVNTSDAVTERLSGFPISAEQHEQGQMKPEQESNSSINIAINVNNTRSPYPRLDASSYRGQLTFIRVPPVAPGKRSMIGAHSATVEALCYSEMNRFLYAPEGRSMFPGRNAAPILNEWKWFAAEPNDHQKEHGTRTVTPAKICEVIDIWAGCGRQHLRGDTFYMTLTKRTDPGGDLGINMDLRLAAENKKRTNEGLPELKGAHAELWKLAQASAPFNSATDLTAVPTPREYWVWIPVAMPGRTPLDAKLYINEHVVGAYYYVGSMDYYNKGDSGQNFTALRQAVNTAIYPVEKNDKWLKALMSLPVLNVHLRA